MFVIKSDLHFTLNWICHPPNKRIDGTEDDDGENETEEEENNYDRVLKFVKCTYTKQLTRLRDSETDWSQWMQARQNTAV